MGKVRISLIILLCLVLISKLSIVENTYAYFIDKNLGVYTTMSGDIDFNASLGEIQTTKTDDKLGINYSRSCIIKNIGSYGELLRISIIPIWKDLNGSQWIGDISFIKYSVENSISFDEGQLMNNEGDICDIENIDDVSKLNNNRWISDDNGYFYYKNILKAGESIIFNIDWIVSNMPCELIQIYKDKQSDIKLSIEVVQATDIAHRSVWNESNEKVKELLDDLCNYNEKLYSD